MIKISYNLVKIDIQKYISMTKTHLKKIDTKKFEAILKQQRSKGLVEQLFLLSASPFSDLRKHYDKLLAVLHQFAVAHRKAEEHAFFATYFNKLLLNLYHKVRHVNKRKHYDETLEEYLASLSRPMSDFADKEEKTKKDKEAQEVHALEQEIAEIHEAYLDYININSLLVADEIERYNFISNDGKNALAEQLEALVAEAAKLEPDHDLIAKAPLGLQMKLFGEAHTNETDESKREILTPEAAIGKHFADQSERIQKACAGFCGNYLPQSMRLEDKNRPKPEPGVPHEKQNEELLDREVKKQLVGDLLLRLIDTSIQAHCNETEQQLDNNARVNQVIEKYESPNTELVNSLLAVLQAARRLHHLNIRAELRTQHLESELAENIQARNLLRS